MSSRTLFTAGRVFLIVGMILKFTLIGSPIPVILLSLGGTMKLVYVLIAILNKSYIPGIELLLLIVGLTIFLSGLYMKNHGIVYGTHFVIVGLVFKICFLVLFVKAKKRQQLLS